VNSTTITPLELSYIDGSTSNIQNQINTTNGNVGTINTILTTNQINNSTNVIDSINQLQSQIDNLPNSGVGSGTVYYFTSTTNTNNN